VYFLLGMFVDIVSQSFDCLVCDFSERCKMVCASWLQRSLIGAAVCVIAGGCSGDSDNPLRVPNKPPVITKDSLKWEPSGLIRPNRPYTFSVRALDPDIGDRIVSFYWKFMDDKGNVLSAPAPTSVPSVNYTFGQFQESDNMFFSLSVYAVDQKGGVGAEEVFVLPMASGQTGTAADIVDTTNYNPYK
jgi:hypothetical protein